MYIRTLGFVASSSNTSPFVFKGGADTVYLLLYVDDIILIASSTTLQGRLIHCLHAEFTMTDLGDIHHFLGIAVTRTPGSLFLSQHQYTTDLLHHAGMLECHATTAPVGTRAKLYPTDGSFVANPSEYQSVVDSLQYLTLTCPDTAYTVQ